MKKSILFMFILIISLVFGNLSSTKTINASFMANNIIDDSIFNNTGAIAPTNTNPWSGIDTFLNSQPQSCISYNNGFTTSDLTGYSPSSGYTYGQNVSAGKVIYDAASVYGLNPQVLLTTLQKEQSLVTGSAGCDVLSYTGAMGYGCPDSGTVHSYSGLNLYNLHGDEITSVNNTCVNSAAKAGFSQQVIHAAWLLKFGQQRSEGNVGWAVITGSWNNCDDNATCYTNYPSSCYSGPMTQGTLKTCTNDVSGTYHDGYTTIDGSSTHMDNGSTAALYWYTPHFSGNQHFDTIFEQTFKFGSVHSPAFGASYQSMSPTPNLKPGETAKLSIAYSNTGNYFWKDDTTVFPGYHATHLAATNPINRSSRFATTGWINSSRPSGTFSKVFESDGVTLASDQHTVQPGQIGQFTFNVTVPGGTSPGPYQEYIQPVQEGAPNWGMGGWGYINVNVVSPITNATYQSMTPTPNVKSGQTATVSIAYTNTGNTFWKDDTTVFPGYHATHLAATNPINRSSRFATTGWINSSRPSGTFSKVFESDGVTLASDQHTVQPGQIGQFTFNVTVPGGTSPGPYQEYIQPVQEGAPNWGMGGWGYINVNVLQ